MINFDTCLPMFCLKKKKSLFQIKHKINAKVKMLMFGYLTSLVTSMFDVSIDVEQ